MSGPKRETNGELCYGEDNSRDFSFSGVVTAGETFQTSLYFCDWESGWRSPGGTGYVARLESKGRIELNLVYPDGTVEPGIVLSDKKPDYERAKCAVPLAFEGGGILSPLEGGPGRHYIRVTFLDKSRDTRLRIEVDMAHAAWQRDRCEPEDWRISE